MPWYSQYRGRSCGRVLHGLETYVDGHGIVDQVQVGNGKVTLYGKTFATYTWEDEDTPVFDFVGENSKCFAKRQRMLRPVLDDYEALASNYTYVVQELSQLFANGELNDDEVDRIIAEFGYGRLEKYRNHLVKLAKEKSL